MPSATNKLIRPLVMALFAPVLASPSSARALENRIWGSNFARVTCTGPQHDSTPGTHWAKVDSPTIVASECLLAPGAGSTALRRVGDLLESVDDVIANPNLLKGKLPGQVSGVLKKPGWRVETLGKGSQKGKGWVLREYTPQGNPTGQQLRWHPGGGHHGPDPYWRVITNTGNSGIIR